MSLKDNWTDLIDGDSEVVVKPINDMAHAIIEVEEKTEKNEENTNRYKQVVANALKGSASGEVVALKDVSPLEHGLGVRVSSKNLLDITSILGKTVSLNGGTLSCGLDGGITGSGTPTGSTSFHSFTKINIPNGEYILSVTGDFKNLACALYCFSKDGTRIKSISVNNDISNVRFNTYDLPEGFYMAPEIKRKTDNVEMSGTAYFQLKKDTTATTATAYTPFVPDVGAVKVKAMGKNLCDKSVISLSGDTLIEQSVIDYFLDKYPFFRHGTYTMSADVTVYPEDTAEYRFFDVNVFYDDGSNELKRVGVASPTSTPAADLRDGKARHYSITFATDISKKLKGFRLRPLSSSINTGRFCKAENIQLEFGTETEYEPYIEPVEYAVSADGTVEGVKSIYPATTLTTDTVGALIEVDYNRDINKAFAELQQAIISLGGNV